MGGAPVLRTYHSYNDDNKLSSQGWQIGSDSFTQTYNYGEWDGNLSAVVLSDNDTTTNDLTVSYTYDALRRLATVSNGVFTTTYNYEDNETALTASPRLHSVVHSNVNYSGKVVECNYTYGYDVNGNITSVAFGIRNNTYVYDANNQLVRENNDRKQFTQTWEYDEFGNITSTSRYKYTTEDELGDPTSTVTYGYTDSEWGDLLKEYNNQTIEYDAIGNPLFVRDLDNNVVKSYTWTMGRQMATHMTKGVTWTYTYDADGMRTGRTNGTTSYQYIYAGDKLVRMIRSTVSGTDVVDFGYAGSQVATMTYNGATYYYVLNGQGDVVALTDSTGKAVVGYYYTAYGIPLILLADAELTPVLKYLNPFLYRGYVYDIESALYYLQSRYYDPELGRFINADAYASTGQGILGNNMFTYCLNNPANCSDSQGTSCEISMKALDIPGSLYIHDQSEGPWSKLPLGSSTVAKSGCGLVAIYNAMITLGDHRNFSEICAFFEGYPSGLMDHGKNGLFLGYVAAYFYHEGYSVVIVSSQDTDQFMIYSQYADACILLYQYGAYPNSNGHYVEYSKSGGQYIGRNTAEGNGIYAFDSPVQYGFKGDRSVFWGVFVFKPRQ